MIKILVPQLHHGIIMYHVHSVWWGNQEAGFPAQKSKFLGQGMQTLPSNVQVSTAGGGCVKCPWESQTYHKTVSLWYYSHCMSCRLCMPKKWGRTPAISFWVETTHPPKKTNLCFEPMFDQRSSWTQNGNRKERLQHPSVCIGTGKQLLWRANWSLRIEACGRLPLLKRWKNEICLCRWNRWPMANGCKTISKLGHVLFRSNAAMRFEHDLHYSSLSIIFTLSTFQIISICFNHPLPRAAANTQM